MMKLLLIAALLALCAILFLLGFIIGFYHGSAPDEKNPWAPDNYGPMDNIEPFAHQHFHLN